MHTLLISLIAMAAAQGTSEVAAQTAPQERGRGSEPAPLSAPAPLLGRGGVEAPRQPRGQSFSSFGRTGRFQLPSTAAASRRIQTPVGSLVAARGAEDNVIWGIGIVDGLAGTGDSSELAKQLLQNMLQNQNLRVELGALASKNIAVVRVEGELSAGTKPGRRIDVRVSSIGDAKSLVGGNLMLTELTDMGGSVVYATAAGPITVGGFSSSGDSASATKNHVTVGIMSGGGKVEREVPTNLVSEHGYIYLDAKRGQDSLGNLVSITEAINSLYPRLAVTQSDGKTIRVEVPADLPEEMHVAFLDTILKLEVSSDNLARVVVNERTGVIVMGGDVRLRPGAIAQGSLVVTIAETPEASQPGPLSGGTTQTLGKTNLGVTEENNALVVIPSAVTLQEVVDVLNTLGATPRDMISILSAMSDAGLLVAEIRRM